MQYNELRKDFLLDRWVVIATERARRPTDFAKPKKESASSSVCPMCAGNEHMTPPAVLVYLKSNGEVVKDRDMDVLRHKNWLIRCVPNLYPAFAPPKQETDKNQMMSSTFGYAVGHHEVLIEAPEHTAHPADSDIQQLVYVVDGYLDRLSELSSLPYVKYVSIFRNHGAEAGASLSHAHSQLIAMPFVPSTVKAEIAGGMDFWQRHERCCFCDLIERESNSQRIVFENEHFVALAPYASVNPMEFWILPKRHDNNPLKMTVEEKVGLANGLKITLKALKDLVNDPPYNYGFHLSLNKEDESSYHWHVEVYPRLAIWAGFEKSTGTYINTIPPETAAAELKRAINL